MDVLVGTTNPSKLMHFRELLAGCDARLLSLTDLGITDDPNETGGTPEENARIKAAFYGQYFDRVICNDSGLYLGALGLLSQSAST